MNIYIDLLFILVLGLLASYTDIYKHIIKNSHLAIVGSAYLILQVAFVLLGFSEWSFILKHLVAFLSALFIGYFVWYMGFWGAGDAKLFAIFSLVLPVNGFGTPLYFLVNALIPLFLYLFYRLVFFTSAKSKLSILKITLSPDRILSYILIVFSLYWFVQQGLLFLGIETNFFINIILVVGLLKLAMVVWKWNILILLGILSLVRAVLDFSNLLTVSFWINFVFVTVAYGIIIIFISDLGYLFATKVPIKQLQVGMIPMQVITYENKKFKRTMLTRYSYNRFMKRDTAMVYVPSTDGLSKKDIATVIDLYQKKKFNFKDILIQQTVPFAPFLFLGAIITFAIQTNLIAFVLGLLH